ncbi:MAG: hypothetical protein OEU92_13405 [Alphaproteobacteria bacterium]|nr:hypothetical protein [Alphaproteobacteria bacterium]
MSPLAVHETGDRARPPTGSRILGGSTLATCPPSITVIAAVDWVGFEPAARRNPNASIQIWRSAMFGKIGANPKKIEQRQLKLVNALLHLPRAHEAATVFPLGGRPTANDLFAPISAKIAKR